jgi:hypothetical protein
VRKALSYNNRYCVRMRKREREKKYSLTAYVRINKKEGDIGI